jgi:hypothetical protein
MRNLKFYTVLGAMIIVLSLTIAIVAPEIRKSTFAGVIQAEADAKAQIINQISGDFLKKLDQLN